MTRALNIVGAVTVQHNVIILKYFGVIRIAGSKMRQDALNVFDIKREAAAAREKSPPRGRLLPPILPWEISTCLKTS